MTHLLRRVLIVVIKVLVSLLLLFLLLQGLANEAGDFALSPRLLPSNQESRYLVQNAARQPFFVDYLLTFYKSVMCL